MNVSKWVAVSLAVTVTVFMFPYSKTLFHVARENAPVSVGIKTYAKDTYGISFSYPSAYVLSEGIRGTILDERFQVLLVHEADVRIPTGGEGPRAITVELYERNSDLETLRSWLARTPQSNYTLGDTSLTEVRVDGREGLRYGWDGLYRGETTALVYGSSILLVSVTYDSPQDAIVGDYHAVLETLHLSK